MKEEIISNIENPKELERLYRENKIGFEKEFNLVYPEISDKAMAKFWHERLNFGGGEISWGSRNELLFVVVASFIAGLVAKIPEFISIKEDIFYPRNISFIVFPFLAAYFAWKQKLKSPKLIVIPIIFIVSAIYINLLPNNLKSDTLILACIHLPLFLWATLGFTFVGGMLNNYGRRIEFLRYNGDLVVMAAVMVIAGGLLTGITLGLFELIGLKIHEFYFKYVVVWGAASIPIIGTYLVQTNPQLVNKVSPIIARIFTPLVLVTLVVYLLAVIYTGKNPYNDREFLLLFNFMLIGVMAIILFSITASSKTSGNKLAMVLLLCLSIVTIVVNSVALSAILFRISEWGITPNRLAVMGGNVLILINLLIVTYRLYNVVTNKSGIVEVENAIAMFLPFYTLWTIIVAFAFPLLFWFS